jgi:hypothetical protein
MIQLGLTNMKKLLITLVVIMGLFVNVRFVQAEVSSDYAYPYSQTKKINDDPIKPVQITGQQLNNEMKVFIQRLTGKWVLSSVTLTQSGQTDEMGNSYIGKLVQFEAGITGLTLEQKKLITEKLLSYGLGKYYTVRDILESDKMWFGAGVRWELHEELLPKVIQ